MLTFANKYDNITKLSRGGRSGPERREEAERKVRKKFLTRRTEADIINRLSRKKESEAARKKSEKSSFGGWKYSYLWYGRINGICDNSTL